MQKRPFRKIRRSAVSIGRPGSAVNRIKQPLSLKSPAQRRGRLVDSRFPVPVSINSPSYADISRLDRFDFEARKQLSQRDGTRFVPRSTFDAAHDTVGWGSFNRAVEPAEKNGKKREKGGRTKEKRTTGQREREGEEKEKNRKKSRRRERSGGEKGGKRGSREGERGRGKKSKGNSIDIGLQIELDGPES